MNAELRGIDRALDRPVWLRWYDTLRWMPARQLTALLRQRARSALERTGPFGRRRCPAEPGLRWSPDPFSPPARPQNPDLLRAGRFVFVNREQERGWPPRWEGDAPSRLWLYNLHYFEYLWSLPYEAGRELILDWIQHHALAPRRVGWEPYPTSVRLSNWCAWLFGHYRERTLADRELRARVWPSIWLQAEWLRRHFEIHLRGNHLLENAAALAFCGACFGNEAWLREGIAWLDRELPEQMLADGVHFERSPMYHARVLHVLSWLEASSDPELVKRTADRVARARAALARLCHPDGEIALLNDAAFGIAPHPAELVDRPAPEGPFALRDAGYYGARAAGHYVVCDAAPIGPDYQPGHAHGDLFSFELALGGQRVIVDAGVHGYDGDPLRAWSRSTRAHNTVELEGEDQCEFWGVFRVARRARPRDVAWRAEADGFRLSGWHDGYERLAGRPRHAREFRWYADGVLLVRDRVMADCEVSARSRLHLHPDCALTEVQRRHARVRYPGGEFQIAFDGEGELAVEPSAYCPEFGRQLESQALVLVARGRAIESGFCVAHGAGDVGYDLASGATVRGRLHPW